MKRKSMLGLLLLFILFSCQKEDDANVPTQIVVQKIEITGDDITTGVNGQITAKL